MSAHSSDKSTLPRLLLAYLSAPWHLRRMPSNTPDERRRRAVWCRDHCGTFAGRWFILGLVIWLIQFSPLGFLFVIAGIPLLALIAPLAFLIGFAHLIAQIVAQKRVGPPPIDPPVDRDE